MKRLAVLVLIVFGLIGIAIAAAPLIAATDISKRRIASQIEEWTGHPVTFTGKPTVKLFPFLSLTIEDARIGADADHPLVVMDRLTCKLRLFQFLLGITEVAEFQLVRPDFRLTVDADGNANWIPGGGAIATAAPATPRQIADIKLGRFKIIDGTVIYDNRQLDRHEELDHVSVNLRWPQVGQPASGTGAFTWRNEPVEFNVSLGQPLNLIANNVSPVRFGLASKPLRLSFTGNASSLGELQLDGETTITTPSVRRVVEWLGTPMNNGPILGAGLIEGDLNWAGSSFTFPRARIELDGNVADGSVSIDLSEGTPRVQGTFALEKLDLSAYLESLRAATNLNVDWRTVPIDIPLELANLDVRLSADQILAGSLRIGTTAAAVTVNDGRFNLNIGEAQFYGGRLKAEVWADTNEDRTSAGARIAIADTPAAVTLDDIAQISFIDGLASVEMDLNAEGATWGDLIASLNGTGNTAISEGELIGFELGQLARLSGGYGVADPAPGSGTVPFNSFTATLELDDGAIFSDDVVAEGDSFALNFSGEVSLVDLDIRGRGVLKAERATAADGERRDIPFVVSGSWWAPFLLPDYERLIRRGANRNDDNPPVGATTQSTDPNG